MDEKTTLFTSPAPTPEQVVRAEAKQWPDGLLERMLALRLPLWKIEESLSAEGFPTLDMIESQVSDRERLASGLFIREATWEDDERLSDLFADSSERLGDWDVTVERSPNPYAQQRLQENWHVKLLEDRGVALGVNVQAGRSSFIGGRPLSVGWMGGWRVRNGFRRLGYSSMLLNAPGSAAGHFGVVSYWYVRLENGMAQSWISHEVTDVAATSGRALDKLTATVHHLDATTGGRLDGRVRRVRPHDLARCVELINATHGGLDLFRPYSVESLSGRLDDLFWGPKPPFIARVYDWDDMAVLEEDGEIVACGGLWDRGRDVRERWRNRTSGEERTVDTACLMDFGFAPGHEGDMAALIGHHLAATRELGRTTLSAPLEFLPSLEARLQWVKPEPETRLLEAMGFTVADQHIEPGITRPYTDLAYW